MLTRVPLGSRSSKAIRIPTACGWGATGLSIALTTVRKQSPSSPSTTGKMCIAKCPPTAGFHFSTPDPGNNEIDGRFSALEISPKRASVEQVASHSVMGGVGEQAFRTQSRDAYNAD